MDSLFVEGVAATVSAIIVFCGSVWLLLALVLGPRLAYFVTASVTLGFMLLMGGVWSYGEPLGPVGELESYRAVGVADTIDDVQFGPAAEYPEGGWMEAGEDEALVKVKTGAEGAASDELEAAIEAGEVTEFTAGNQAAVDVDATRVLDQDGTLFAAVRFEPVPTPEEEEEEEAASEEDTPAGDDVAAGGEDTGEDGGDGETQDEGPDPDAEAFVVLEQDPGNPSGDARMITAGFFVLFVLHLLGLNRSEKRARRTGAEA